MAALALVPRPAPTLYDLEEHLAALMDSAETVAPEQEGEFLAEFGKALTAAVEKRDRVAQFMSHLESQVDLAKAEIERLSQRKHSFEAALDHLKGYVVRVIEASGAKKLEGTTVTLALRKCPASVEVLDPAAIPLDYKNVECKLPARLFDRLLDSAEFEVAAEVMNLVGDRSNGIDKRAVKAALDASIAVPGARIADPKNALVRR